jgi:hypothetical protein
MLGAFAGENDLEIANAPGKAHGGTYTYPVADAVEWAVVLEGTHAQATAAAARTLLSRRALSAFGVRAAPAVGTYTLLFGNDR